MSQRAHSCVHERCTSKVDVWWVLLNWWTTTNDDFRWRQTLFLKGKSVNYRRYATFQSAGESFLVLKMVFEVKDRYDDTQEIPHLQGQGMCGELYLLLIANIPKWGLFFGVSQRSLHRCVGRDWTTWRHDQAGDMLPRMGWPMGS